MIIRIIILMSLNLLCSCANDKEVNVKDKEVNVNDKEVNSDSISREYEETYYLKASNVTYDEKYKLVEISLKNIYMTIKLIDFDSYVSLKINDTYKDKYIELDFNHAYGEDLDSAMDKSPSQILCNCPLD